MASTPASSSSSISHLSARRRKLEQLHRKTLAFSGTTPPANNISLLENTEQGSKEHKNISSLDASSAPSSVKFARSALSKFANPLPSPSSSKSSSDDKKKKTIKYHRSRLPKDFDKSQVRRSCIALLKHAHQLFIQKPASLSNADNETLDSDSSFTTGEPIYLNIQTFNEIASLRAIVPYLIPLPNRIRPKLNDLSICLITRDPRAPVVDILENDKQSPTHGIFTEIISAGKLRSRLITFGEAVSKKKRRSHLDSDEPPNKKAKKAHENPQKFAAGYAKSFDIIANDTEITPESLTHVFGSGVYLKAPGIKITVPVPVSFQPAVPEDATPAQVQKIRETVADPIVIKNQLKYIARSSAVIKAPGKNLNILVGLSSFTPEQLMENIAATISNILQKQSTLIPGSWDNVKAITIKTAKSANMPIYSNSANNNELAIGGKANKSDDEDEESD